MSNFKVVFDNDLQTPIVAATSFALQLFSPTWLDECYIPVELVAHALFGKSDAHHQEIATAFSQLKKMGKLNKGGTKRVITNKYTVTRCENYFVWIDAEIVCQFLNKHSMHAIDLLFHYCQIMKRIFPTTNVAFITHEELALLSGISVSTVSAYNRELEKMHLIAVGRRKPDSSKHYQSNVYATYENYDLVPHDRENAKTSANFHRSVAQRYNNFIATNGAGFTEDDLERLILDVERYNDEVPTDRQKDIRKLKVEATA